MGARGGGRGEASRAEINADKVTSTDQAHCGQSDHRDWCILHGQTSWRLPMSYGGSSAKSRKHG